MNKYVLITGASSGIGQELAKKYAEKGNNLILVARRINILEQFKNNYPDIDIHILQKDLSNVESSNEIYKYTEENNLFVVTLINNAGVGLFGNFIETDLEREISMINLNIVSLVSLTKLYLKNMKNKNEGQILNVSSVASFMPGPKMSVYYATKAFVTSFSNALYHELKDSNIKVSILAPGATSTGFVKSSNLENSKLFDNMRVQTPELVADYTMRNMGKRLIIPGILNRLSVFSTRFTPTKLLMYFVEKIQQRKDEK
ncbi:SDR family oxidoreductase [Streptobacillus felis]|uniref:SDR family oxidoreductase n=1 Tax=Streptobacillus felis TaxID=1384509 RepID=A0A7Z0PDM5_9FUSO|nr:SDR family oxidoreductase [Streptobacillus felis]NYV27324.1 SDR family oxidoreductase [Streptobacillus felis]